MAQHDYNIANQSGQAFRADLNNALAAIVSQNSGASAPSTTYAYQYWVDTSTSPATLKQRNSSNNAWITIGLLDTANLGLIPAGSGSIVNADVNANAGIVSSKLSFTQAGTGATTRTAQSKLRDVVSVKDFGAVGDGTTNDATAIQAALNYVRDAGGTLIFPDAATYKCNSALTLLRSTTNGPEQYVIEGNGSTITFASSGLTSGSLFSLGATSQANGHDTGFIVLNDLRIIGPEPGAPYSGDTPAGSTVGLSLEYCFNTSINNVYIQGCYKGVNSNFAFHVRASSVELKSNYIGLYLEDDSTLATWIGLSVTSSRYAVVARPSDTTKIVSNQHFITPRFEQCLVGAAIDPRSGSSIGVRSIRFESPYLEAITYDYFRIGLQWTFADPATRNADATRDVYWTHISGGLWDGVNWTGSKGPLVCSSNGTVKGGKFLIPAARSNTAGSLVNSQYASTYDANIGDSSKIENYDNAAQIFAKQPSFSAYVGSQVNDVTGDATSYTIICNTKDYDVAGDFSTSTGAYTARYTGKHLVIMKVFLGGLTSSHTTGQIDIVTNSKTITQEFNPFAVSASGEASFNLQWICQMDAGHTATIRVRVNGGTKVVDVKPTQTQFAAHFLG